MPAPSTTVAGVQEERPEQETLLYFPQERKSLVMAYVLLLIGGVFGLHWAYLGDERKYKLYACTLGLCGVGVIGDLMRLPELVAEVNASPGRRRRSELDISQGSSPSDSRNASRSATPQQTPLHAQRQARALAPRGRDVEEGGGGVGSADAVGSRGQGGGVGNAGGGGGVAGAEGMRDGQSRGAPQATSGRRRLTQAQELKHLCDMFSNLDAEEIKRTWAEARRDVTRSVELLSALSDAQRRQVQVVNSPMPASLAAESSSANLNEDGLMECLICFGVGIDALLLPCQHSGLCAHCAEAVLRRSPPLCPICRMHVSEVLRFVDDTPKDSAGMPAAPIDVIDVRVEDWPARDEHADPAQETDAPMHAPRESALQDSVPQAGALPESEPQGRGNEATCPVVAALPAPDGEEPRRRRCTSTESVEAGAGSEGRPASACDPVAVQGEAEVSLQDMSEARREGLRPASAADFGAPLRAGLDESGAVARPTIYMGGLTGGSRSRPGSGPDQRF